MKKDVVDFELNHIMNENVFGFRKNILLFL